MSLCMQLHFSGERGKYRCDKSAQPVTKKERAQKRQKSISRGWKPDTLVVQLHAKWRHKGMVLLRGLVIKKQNHTTHIFTALINVLNIYIIFFRISVEYGSETNDWKKVGNNWYTVNFWIFIHDNVRWCGFLRRMCAKLLKTYLFFNCYNLSTKYVFLSYML